MAGSPVLLAAGLVLACAAGPAAASGGSYCLQGKCGDIIAPDLPLPCKVLGIDWCTIGEPATACVRVPFPEGLPGDPSLTLCPR